MVHKVILLFPLLVLSNSLSAQVGLTARYQASDPKNWILTDVISNSDSDLLGNGFAVGVDYWFRFKNFRLELLPELNYSHFETLNINNAKLRANWLGFYFNANVYPFDFKGDCDCPTWSKQGDFFSKGFFVQLSPGISYLMHSVQTQGEAQSSNTFAFSLGAGIGLDIGLSDFFTLSPMFGLRYFPSAEWDKLNQVPGSDPHLSVSDTQTSILLWQAGLRLGLRLDE